MPDSSMSQSAMSKIGRTYRRRLPGARRQWRVVSAEHGSWSGVPGVTLREIHGKREVFEWDADFDRNWVAA